jgi:ABC-type dipeptide/oligopeptide/nickel transport system ATPase component
MAELQLRGINKSFGAVKVIHDVDLDIGDGEFVVFVGPSGCGKSTLLRTISGLEEPSAGQVLIGGEDVTDFDPSERGVAMVFQSYALYPHMTVEENLGFGLRMGGMPKDQVASSVTCRAGARDERTAGDIEGRGGRPVAGRGAEQPAASEAEFCRTIGQATGRAGATVPFASPSKPTSIDRRGESLAQTAD